MIKLKPLRITDFYAPTTNLTKIADFGIPASDLVSSVPVKPVIPPVSNPIVPIISANNSSLLKQKNNTWIYVAIVLVLIVGTLYLANRAKRKEEETYDI